jgi:Cu(I)/Ag(I) efflux system membrane fusion protein
MATTTKPIAGWLLTALGLASGILAVMLIPATLLFVPAAHVHELGAEPGVRYVCPMLDYVGDHAGRCPICGMILQRVAAGDFNREQVRRMGLEVTTIASGNARLLIRGYGTVIYDMRTAQAVIPRVAGRVVKRFAATLHDGVEVAVGDPLIDIYSPELFAAQSELQSAHKLGETAVVAALKDRFARLNLASLADAIMAGGQPHDTVTLTSPYAGHVHNAMAGGKEESQPVQIGDQISADHALITLLDHEALMVKIHVPEVYSRYLRTGLPVSIASDDLGELNGLDAHVDWLAPEINTEIRARELHIHLRDPSHRLLAGALIQARIHVALGQELGAADPATPATWGSFTLIPKSAVLSTGVRDVAWRQVTPASAERPARFVLVQLALGPRLEDEGGSDRYVVRAGLKPGDVVATQGAFLIDSQAQLAGSPSLLFPDGAPAAGSHAEAH